jgi:hypothetical protein
LFFFFFSLDDDSDDGARKKTGFIERFRDVFEVKLFPVCEKAGRSV